VAPPGLSAVDEEVYVPLLSVTVPDKIAVPEPPLTPTVTVNGCVVVMLLDAGVTVIAGVVNVTVTMPVPEAGLKIVEPTASGV
jgi:hypothetical protein